MRLGVHEATIINWEKGLCPPSVIMIPRIVDFLGYCPYEPPPQTLGEKLGATRRRLGLTKSKFAHRLGVDPGTLSRWEEGVREPRGRLLVIVDLFLERHA